MLSLTLFRRREFNGTLVAAMGYYLAGFGALPVISLWLQDGVGLGSLATALVITVQPVAFFATSAVVSSTLHRLPAHWTLGGGALVVGAGNVLMLAVGADSSWAALVPGLVVTGVGAGIVSPVLPSVAMSAAPASQSGVASAAANCARQLGLALGIAVLGSVFHQFSATTSGGTDVPLTDVPVVSIPVTYVNGLSAVFVVAAGIGLGSGALAFWLLKSPRPAVQPA